MSSPTFPHRTAAPAYDCAGVPGLQTALNHSAGALGHYLALRWSASSLDARELETVALVAGQVNQCLPALAFHMASARLAGLGESEVAELRHGHASFDARLDALARLVRNLAIERGYADTVLLDNFYRAGYDRASLADLMLALGQHTVAHYLLNAS